MNKRHYEHTLPNIRGSLSNTYRVHDSEIDFFRFIAIAAKDVFDCYVHGSIGLIEVFWVHWSLWILRLR